MSNLPLVGNAVAVLLAWALCRRLPSRSQRSLLRALALLLAADLARRVTAPADLAARVAAYAAGETVPPYEGAARWAWAVRQLSLWAWYAAAAGAVVVGLKLKAPSSGMPERAVSEGTTDERARGVSSALLLAAAALVVTLFFAYPVVRGQLAVGAAVAVKAASLAVVVAAAMVGAYRWHLPAREDRAAWATGWLIAAGSLASAAAGAWSRGAPVQDWALSPWISVPVWTIISGVHLWMLLSRPTGSPTR